MQIRKSNIASTGLKQYEQRGTVAIDFPDYLGDLSKIENINLDKLFAEN